MKGMRDIRNRMKAVASTGQITHAMELVAASKMKKAQNSAEAGRAYAILLMDLTETVLERLGKSFVQAGGVAPGKKRLIIVFSTDKGLCGSLNTNIFKSISEIGRADADYIAVGTSAGRFIAKSGRSLKGQFKIGDTVTFAQTSKIANFAIKLAKESGEYGSIEVLYPIFVNTLKQETALVKLAPVDDLHTFIDRLRKTYKMDGMPRVEEDRNIKFEPSADEVLSRLPQFYIKQSLHHIALDAKASEHSARMVAMKSASDNADTLMAELNLEYNKARQSAITTEILELSSAAAETNNDTI